MRTHAFHSIVKIPDPSGFRAPLSRLPGLGGHDREAQVCHALAEVNSKYESKLGHSSYMRDALVRATLSLSLTNLLLVLHYPPAHRCRQHPFSGGACWGGLRPQIECSCRVAKELGTRRGERGANSRGRQRQIKSMPQVKSNLLSSCFFFQYGRTSRP